MIFLTYSGTDKPKPEKAAQLVFFGVANSYCKANNIDISPEFRSAGVPSILNFPADMPSACSWK